MGIHGIYQEIGRGERVALSKLAAEKFEETGRPLRIAIDVSIWLFQIQASKGGTNPAPRTFYYRLLRLVALCIDPIFVFDGPNKPPFKRGKRTGANVSSIPDFLAKQLIKQFGFPIHYAPGEAEAECALLQREGIVDAVLSEDVDTLMFGSQVIIRNWSPELKSGKTPTHVNLYDAVKTKNGPLGLDQEGMILVALMSGGDYVPEGIPGCGPKTACEAARAGFGSDLCGLRKSDKAGYQQWRERLQHELRTNESKFFKRRHTTLKIPEDFPRLDILGYYTHPVISPPAGLDSLRRSMKWDREIDFPGLRSFTHDAFDWIKLEGAKHFIRSLAPSVLVRGLRMRAEGQRLASDDLVAIQEDEALLIKGIHGRRQHAITDGATELRVSFTPIELVKIDLGIEDPDEFPSTQEPPPSTQGGDSADIELDAIEIEDEENVEGVRKRGPTKFDPSKPARVWVMETYVRAGVPLTTEDWAAGLLRPKGTTKAKNTSKSTSNARTSTAKSRRVKTGAHVPNKTIDQYARVTKPRAKTVQSQTKAQDSSMQSLPTMTTTKTASAAVIDLLSSPPAKSASTMQAEMPREKSLSPVQELPASVTKRRRRGPIQRSRTLPVDLESGPESTRPLAPPSLCTIDTLDLISSPVRPPASQARARKAKRRSTETSAIAQPRQQESLISPARKNRQTTLDEWCSSPIGTPSKTRKERSPRRGTRTTSPPLRSPTLKASLEMDSLDLTFSPAKPQPPIQRVPTAPSKQADSLAPASRPVLQSISSNTSFSSTSSHNASSNYKKSTPEIASNQSTRRSSPRFSKTGEADILDLTGLSSPIATPRPIPQNHRSSSSTSSSSSSSTSTRQDSEISTPRNDDASTSFPAHQPSSEQQRPRRSPRNHPPSPTQRVSPPAAWKERKKKKRLIQLRQSIPGSWDLVDAPDTPPAPAGSSGEGHQSRIGDKVDNGVALKGKARRRWRESEIEVLDLC